MKPSEQRPDIGDLPTIVYLRVASSDPADQAAGIDRQQAAIARAAHRLGLTVAEEFVDLGCSGLTLDHPARRRLPDHIATRPVGYTRPRPDVGRRPHRLRRQPQHPRCIWTG